MKNKKTLYHFIVDRSGSMLGDRVNTVNMFNRQVATARSLALEFKEQDVLTGLTFFNDRVDHIMEDVPAIELRELSLHHYMPDGLTALYDAIGESVQRIQENYRKEIEANEMSVVVIILTDGHENASRRYGVGDVARIIKELEDSEKWTFTILGADFDITSVSARMNFREKAAVNYSKAEFMEMSEDIESSMRHYTAMKDKGTITKDFFKKKDRR